MDVQTFLRDPGNVALRLPADEVFGVLSRRLELPPSFTALVVRDDQTTALPARGIIESRGVVEVVFIRSTPIPITFGLPSIESADGFECTVSLGLSLQLVTERSDLEAFARAILGSSRRADTRRLVLYLQDAVTQALFSYVKARAAEVLVQPRRDETLEQDLSTALKPLLFAAGLSLLRPITFQIVSPAYEADRRTKREVHARQQRLDEQQRLQQQADEARRKHLEDLSGLLERLDGLAKQRPGIAISELVRTFDLSDRGELYRQLLTREVSAQTTHAIAVVAGAELLLFNPNDGAVLMRRPFAEPLGPLRSVRVAQRDEAQGFLLGAARGVYHFVPKTDSALAYAFEPPGRLRGGVNAAALLGDRLYATHSEVGVLCWTLGQNAPGQVILREHTGGASAVRDIQADHDGTLWFTAADRVIGWSPQSVADVQTASLPGLAAVAPDRAAPSMPADRSASPAPTDSAASSVPTLPLPSLATATGTLVSMGSIAGAGHAPHVAALCVANGSVYAGTSDGRLLAWPCRAPQSYDAILTGEGGPVDSVQWVSGAGVERLLVACRRPHVWLMVRGDVVRGEYRAEEPVRWAAAADDWIIAVNDRRDRLYLWRPWQPQSIERTIPVARMTGHSIQDAALVPVSG